MSLPKRQYKRFSLKIKFSFSFYCFHLSAIYYLVDGDTTAIQFIRNKVNNIIINRQFNKSFLMKVTELLNLLE